MSDQDDFFIGWAAKPPAIDRRFFFASGIALLGTAGGASALVASRQNGGGTGTWNQGEILEWRGRITATPYPMLRTVDQDGTVKTAFLSCMNKCTPALQIDQVSDGEVVVRGSAIRRGRHLMIATEDTGQWITPADGPSSADLSFPEELLLGPIDLKGMILDTKCWFGAMSPKSGKVHKACASLCIRSGLPPAFYVRSLRKQKELLIMADENGNAVGPDVLPFVADSIRLAGAVARRGDYLFLKTPVSSFERLSG